MKYILYWYSATFGDRYKMDFVSQSQAQYEMNFLLRSKQASHAYIEAVTA